MLEREKAYYTAHQAEFREKCLDKQLVITGDSLFGVYDTQKEAVKAAMEHFEPGEFMIHSPADDGRVLEIIGPIIRFRYPEGEKQKSLPVMTYA